MTRNRPIFCCRVALAALLLASAGRPALAITLPSPAEPGHIEKRLEEKPLPPPAPALELPVPAQPLPSAQQEQQLAKKRFVLASVVIEGMTAYTREQVQFAYRDQLGKEISLLDAQAIAGRITSLYRHDGYILSQAFVPPQDIRNGALTIRVVEGVISALVIQDDAGESRDSKLIESYAGNLTSKRPVNIADLERCLLLINDLPGVTARGLLRPSATQSGAAELAVTLTRQAFEGSYTLDNRGSKYVGPWQHAATLTANSALGLYDRTTLRLITTSPTSELRYFDLQHEEPLGGAGTRLALEASHSRTQPGDNLKSLAILGDADFFQARLLHPFLRSRLENLVGRVMFDLRSTDTDVFKATEFSDDRLRVLRAGASYDRIDRLGGADLIDSQLSRGLNLFNASSRSGATSNAHADGTFTKVNLDLSRTQPLPHGFSLLTAASGQYAFEPLLAAEQFTLGGQGFGQAYDPAELSGDHGLAGKAELRYSQAPGLRYLTAWQLYGYYDLGRVWVREGGAGADDKKSLASAGTGVRASFTQHLSGSLELALPLTRPASNQGDHGNSPRLFVSMTGRF